MIYELEYVYITFIYKSVFFLNISFTYIYHIVYLYK